MTLLNGSSPYVILVSCLIASCQWSFTSVKTPACVTIRSIDRRPIDTSSASKQLLGCRGLSHHCSVSKTLPQGWSTASDSTSDHITLALYELHWLPVEQWIIYKLCFLMISLYQAQPLISHKNNNCNHQHFLSFTTSFSQHSPLKTATVQKHSERKFSGSRLPALWTHCLLLYKIIWV